MKKAIEEALPLLDNPETVERAKQLLKKGSDMICERQKFIKIAGTDQGWKTADKYEKDPVANDSDDEKRIRKAESAADKKAVKECRKRPVKSRGFRGFCYPTLPGSVNNGVLELEYSRPSPAALCSNQGCYLTQGGSHALGVEQSHWARDCPMP